MSLKALRGWIHHICNDRSWHWNGWRNEDLWFLWEVGQKSQLGLLVSAGFIFFLEVELARFALSRFVLFQQVL